MPVTYQIVGCRNPRGAEGVQFATTVTKADIVAVLTAAKEFIKTHLLQRLSFFSFSKNKKASPFKFLREKCARMAREFVTLPMKCDAMSRKNKPLPTLEHVTITDVAAEGKALARVNDMVVFVPFVVPGDVVDLQVKRKKHSYAEAVAVKFHALSPLRAEPFCRHFGTCGGCKWQCLKYEEQLRAKQQQVVDALTRIGHLDLPEVNAILGSERQRGYRNKLEFTFSDKRWLTDEEIACDARYDDMNAVGFHIPGCFDKVLNIDECYLMDDLNNRVRNGIRDYALRHGLTFFDLREQTGLLRGMMLRIAENEDGHIREAMLLLQFCTNIESPQPREKGKREEPRQGDFSAEMEGLLAYVRDTFTEITSLLYVVNNKCNDTIGDLAVTTFYGTDFITEQMEGLRFKVGPKSFYQTNTRQAYNLYKVARDFAGLTGNELVYDLYTGTGTIANFVARSCRQVIGIEYVPEAIEDARENALLNGLDNTLFYAGDMKDILTDDFIRAHGRPDVIITDPPRAGMHGDVVEVILHAAPQRIVYVSCNPATQARDLQLLCTQYRVAKVQPVDMFPHTQHVENVVMLERS